MSIRILVVEDEPQIADFVVRGLREEGFTVQHVANGKEGAAAIASGDWGLILLDWWIPGRDGVSLLRDMRDKGLTTPVLMLTARDSVSDRVCGLEAGADDYLCKPFAFAELLARVRALTRRSANLPTTDLHYGNLRMEIASQRVERAGKRLDLTAKEYALLSLFMRHPGQVLSRTRIYEQIWDDRYDGLSNTLEVHVMELRRKLEKHGPRLIQTLRGRGYLFGETATENS